MTNDDDYFLPPSWQVRQMASETKNLFLPFIFNSSAYSTSSPESMLAKTKRGTSVSHENVWKRTNFFFFLLPGIIIFPSSFSCLSRTSSSLLFSSDSCQERTLFFWILFGATVIFWIISCLFQIRTAFKNVTRFISNEFQAFMNR